MFASTAQHEFKLCTGLEIHQFTVQRPIKKSVQTEFISLVPYDTQHDLTAAIHSDAIMASKQKCLQCIAFIMSDSKEQCTCTKFYAELKMRTPTYDMIKTAFQEEAISRMEVLYRFRCFREGCTSAESDEHSGHPSMSSKMK